MNARLAPAEQNQAIPFHVAPIREDFLKKVRETGLDDQGQPVQKMIAEGGEPCRDVLRRANPGEALILASYCPFEQVGPYREYGPVFVLAEASNEPVDYSLLPMPQGQETDYFQADFVLRAYGHQEQIVDATLSSADQAEGTLQRFFASDEVDFVLARFAAYGCYALRMERSTTRS